MDIRSFQSTSTDNTAIFEIYKLLNPQEQLTIELFQKQDSESFEDNEFVRVVGEITNKIVGYGSYWHSPSDSDETYRFAIAVHPNYQDSDMPKLMHNHLLSQLAKVNASIIVSEPKEDEKHLTKLLQMRQL